MKTLIATGILSVLLCVSASAVAHENKMSAQSEVAKSKGDKAVATIEGTVRSVDPVKQTLVVVTASGQEYVLPYVEQTKSPITVGQQVTITISICYRGYCVSVTIKT